MRHPRPTYSCSWIFEGLRFRDWSPAFKMPMAHPHHKRSPRRLSTHSTGRLVVNDPARRQDACHARLASRLSPGTDDPEDLPAKLRCLPRRQLRAIRIPRQQ